MAAMLDSKSIYDNISRLVAPILSQALQEKWTPDQLLGHPTIKLLVAARQVSTAITEEDAAKSLASIRDLRDRQEGRAKERIETTHRLEKLPEDQLDALLMSKLKEVRADDDEDVSH